MNRFFFKVQITFNTLFLTVFFITVLLNVYIADRIQYIGEFRLLKIKYTIFVWCPFNDVKTITVCDYLRRLLRSYSVKGCCYFCLCVICRNVCSSVHSDNVLSGPISRAHDFNYLTFYRLSKLVFSFTLDRLLEIECAKLKFTSSLFLF